MPLPSSLPITHRGGGSPTASLPGTGTSLHIGLESIFEYNGLLLNDRRVVDKYRIIRISGFEDADIRDSRENLPQRHGERPLQAFYAGRTVSLTGRIEAHSLRKLRDMQQALRAAFNDISVERPLTIWTTDFAPGDDVTPTAFLNCKKHQSMTGDESQSNFYFYRDFAVILRASNPKIVSTPKVLVWNSGGSSINAGTIMTPVNNGDFYADPHIRLNGPMQGPVLWNTTTGERLRFKGTTFIPVGASWFVDMVAGTIIDGSGINQFATLDVTSDWPTLAAGPNPIALNASGMTGSSSVTMTYSDTWL